MENTKGMSTKMKLVGMGKVVKEAMSETNLMIVIFTLGLGFIVYALYYYYSSSKDIARVGYTFYGKNLTDFQPIFKIEDVESSKDCVDRCRVDPICKGITYDAESKMCVGVDKGVFRKDDKRFLGWEKEETDINLFIDKTLVIGYAETENIVDEYKLPRPPIINNYLFSFWININEWYHNFEYWKHVFHKGNMPEVPITYREWDEVAYNYPDQNIGVWLAPFTNNMRICVTTRYEEDAYDFNCHPNTMKCKQVSKCDEQANVSVLTAYKSDKGASYRGKQNKTVSGLKCQKWTEQFPHKHNNTPSSKPGMGLANHNYCRNPDDRKTIWCYTNDPQKKWEYCEDTVKDVAKCDLRPSKDDCKLTDVQRNPLKKTGKVIKQLEYFDIKNISVNKPLNIAIAFQGNLMEVYTNGKLYKAIQLKGEPVYNNEKMYIKREKSFEGAIYNLNYSPITPKLEQISLLYNTKPELK